MPLPPRTILLVEDDPDTRDIYGVMLRYTGFQVLEAVNGVQALDLARRHLPDLIVMDLGLPIVDGWEATAALKGDLDTAGIPVLVATVHIQEAYRSRAEAAGCDGFLEKPCPPQRLFREVERFLQRQAVG